MDYFNSGSKDIEYQLFEALEPKQSMRRWRALVFIHWWQETRTFYHVDINTQTRIDLYSKVKQKLDTLEPQESAPARLDNKISGGRKLEDVNSSPRISLITDQVEIRSKLLELMNSAVTEIRIMFPTQNAFRREELIGANDAMDRARERGVKVSILSPFDEDVKETITKHHWQISLETDQKEFPTDSNPLMIRELGVAEASETKVTFAIFDRSESLIIELTDDSNIKFEKAIGLATYSNSKSTAISYIASFQKLWHESELIQIETAARKRLVESLAKEERSSQQVRLLQDILTHDIVNYNQIIKLEIELLENIGVKNETEFRNALKSITSAVDDSTALLDRARKLGKVLASENIQLYPKNIIDSLGYSIALITKINADKKIVHEVKLGSSVPTDGVMALADDFIEEVFTNIFSNAVKYTQSNDVRIETFIDEMRDCWQISIVDQGEGIPDELKPSVFFRYSKGSKGSGLGLSIVRALVVDRYGGTLAVTNRVSGDHSKGTAIKICIPKA